VSEIMCAACGDQILPNSLHSSNVSVDEDGLRCGLCNVGNALDKLDSDLSDARLALENVRMMAMRMRKGPCHEEAAHLLRFCESAGVVGSVLR
jgi:hypothetical protein